MIGYGCKLKHYSTGVLLDIKAFALTHGILAFARDQIGQSTYKVILLFGWSSNLRVRIRIMPCHGTGMYLQIAECTACGKFGRKGSIEYETHEGSVSDVHSELFPGNDGLNDGLGGVESMAGSFVM